MAMADVFITYSRNDREEAAKIVEALRQQGWSRHSRGSIVRPRHRGRAGVMVTFWTIDPIHIALIKSSKKSP